MPATRRGRVYRLRLSRSGTSTRTPASWRTSSSVPSVSAHASARSAGIRTVAPTPDASSHGGSSLGYLRWPYVGRRSGSTGWRRSARAHHPVPNSLPTDGLASRLLRNGLTEWPLESAGNGPSTGGWPGPGSVLRCCAAPGVDSGGSRRIVRWLLIWLRDSSSAGVKEGRRTVRRPRSYQEGSC